MNYKETKKVVLIDLDGVLNEYRGIYDEEKIPELKFGAREFLLNLSNKYSVKLFTTRNRLLTSKWIINNNLDGFIEDVTNIKEPCWLYVDDRCVKFDGDFSMLQNKIDNFKPWYKN